MNETNCSVCVAVSILGGGLGKLKFPVTLACVLQRDASELLFIKNASQ